jgi:hypothetical protein
MKLITKSQALKIMIGIFIMVILFHLAVITRLIPYSIVWGGKLKTLEEMFMMEAVSIAINVFLLTVLLLKGNYIRHQLPARLINGILWLFILLFSLNTVGNLMAESLLERLLFTPLTLISAFLLWKIVSIEKQKELEKAPFADQ